MTPTIFILDGTTQILTLIERQLRSCKFTKIYSFDDPHQALQALKAGVVPDLIITGYEMSAMNGLEFLDRVTDFYPEVNAIIFTGHPEALPRNCPYTAIRKDVSAFNQLFELVQAMFPAI